MPQAIKSHRGRRIVLDHIVAYSEGKNGDNQLTLDVWFSGEEDSTRYAMSQVELNNAIQMMDRYFNVEKEI